MLYSGGPAVEECPVQRIGRAYERLRGIAVEIARQEAEDDAEHGPPRAAQVGRSRLGTPLAKEKERGDEHAVHVDERPQIGDIVYHKADDRPEGLPQASGLGVVEEAPQAPTFRGPLLTGQRRRPSFLYSFLDKNRRFVNPLEDKIVQRYPAHDHPL